MDWLLTLAHLTPWALFLWWWLEWHQECFEEREAWHFGDPLFLGGQPFYYLNGKPHRVWAYDMHHPPLPPTPTSLRPRPSITSTPCPGERVRV